MNITRSVVLAGALACAAAVHAAPLMGQEELKANKVRIEEQYDQAQARCRRVQGHARVLCNERARGERDVQAAELRMRADPSADNDHGLRLARAEARYSMALVACKPLQGTARGVCRRDAKDSFEAARTEAGLQKEVAAQALRSENAVRERTEVAEKIAEAQFRAARERCEMLPAEGRAPCIEDARRRFGTL